MRFSRSHEAAGSLLLLPTSESDEEEYLVRPSQRFSAERKHGWTLTIIFILSISINLLLATYLTVRKTSYYHEDTSVTDYARLSRDTRRVFNASSYFGTGARSEAERSIMWESLDTSAGEISLASRWAQEKNLPGSTPFFWDKGRSVYLLNGYHSLHCMRKVRRWVTLAYYNHPQMDDYEHVVHCMDHLVQNIICEADDTPMYTSSKPNIATGTGQYRMCRSWEKLAQWAESQTACFSYVNETQGVKEVIQRFQYCPQDSTFAEAMKKHFGHGKDWYARRPADIESMPKYWEDIQIEEGPIGAQ